MKIHFWSGNPRNVSRNPYPLAIGTVDSIDEVSIRDGILTINNNPVENIDEVAMIDGFRNFEEMYEFLGDFAGIRIVWNYDQLIRFESKKIY